MIKVFRNMYSLTLHVGLFLLHCYSHFKVNIVTGILSQWQEQMAKGDGAECEGKAVGSIER